MNKQHSVLLSTILISSAIFAIYKVKNNPVKIDSTNIGNTTTSSSSQDKISTDVVLQKLSILGDRCRGCGKCVRIDPAHFEINPTTRKAMVISSINLDSVALIQAINNCQDRAISLR